MDLGINGRTVIVTGASGGIGREVARAFATEGAKVVLSYRSRREQAGELADEIGGGAIAVQYDMADPGSADALVAAAVRATGRVDALVHSAVEWGKADWTAEGFETTPDERWTRTLQTNIEGAVRMTRAVTPLMRESGWGRIVHLSSSLARDGAEGAEYYATAKAALHGFNRSAAFSLGASGDILSNVALLGLTRTDTNGFVTDAEGDHYSALAPIKRLLDAREVARPIVFLASAANAGITGQVVPITGGS
ncbi:SDR family NAD(P)-dependent oxidoreductase [Agromyces subbeticus]|uniref:SDR family NAD(P)-dependent oxidoreductase n=1 Tax=Agromyces subbeticus TaxID=293890 RepID=UPI0003B5DDB6|nr:SDR family oxidoreductase [Agromyces subbeticus]